MATQTMQEKIDELRARINLLGNLYYDYNDVYYIFILMFLFILIYIFVFILMYIFIFIFSKTVTLRVTLTP